MEETSRVCRAHGVGCTAGIRWTVMLTIYLLDHWHITLAIIAILVVVAEVGFRLGRRRQTWVDDNYRSQLSTMQASTFGLSHSCSASPLRWQPRVSKPARRWC